MESVETFGSSLLGDVQFNDDGSLKQSGKQSVKFYSKKRLSFKGMVKVDEAGKALLDDNGKVIPIIDSKTGLPFKEAFEEIVTMVRIETKGDTNIIDDIANDFHKRQFYRQYKYFREGKIPDGNPIEDFEFFQPGVVMELHMLGVHTLQQVAEMNDLECEQLKDQPGYEIRDIAKQWVKINSPSGLASKASRQDLEIAKLKRELEDAKKNARGSFSVAEASAQPPQVEEPAPATMEIDLKSRPRKV